MITKIKYGKRKFNIIGEGIINNTPVLIFKRSKYMYGLPIKTIRERIKQNNGVIKNSVYNSDYLDEDKILVSESNIVRTRNVDMIEVAVHHMNNELMSCNTSIKKYASDYEITFDNNMNVKLSVRKNTIFEGSMEDFMGFKANMITVKIHELILRNINIVFANRNRPNLTAILDKSFRMGGEGIDVSIKDSKTNTKYVMSMSEIDFEGLTTSAEDQIVNRIIQTLDTIEKKENDNMKEKITVTKEMKNAISQKCLMVTSNIRRWASETQHIVAFNCEDTANTGEVEFRITGTDTPIYLSLEDAVSMPQAMFNALVLKHLKDEIIDPVNKKIAETHKVEFELTSDSGLMIIIRGRTGKIIKRETYTLENNVSENIEKILNKIENCDNTADKREFTRKVIVNFFKSRNMIVPEVLFSDLIELEFKFNPNAKPVKFCLLMSETNKYSEEYIEQVINDRVMFGYLESFANTILASKEVSDIKSKLNLDIKHNVMTNITEPTIEFAVVDSYNNTMEYYFCGKDVEKSIKELSLALCRYFSDRERSAFDPTPVPAPTNEEPTTSMKDLPAIDEVVVNMNMLDRMYADYSIIKDFEKRVLNNSGKVISIKYLPNGYVDILINMNSTDRHFTIINGLVVEIKDVDF